jgi:signal transduction histidine kinase
MTFHEFTHPEDLDRDADNYRRLIQKELDHYTIEKRYRHKKGYYIWCLLSVSMVWNNDGSPYFGIAQVQDISAIKTMIGALEQQNAQLELTTLDLENKISQLEEFNQIVAHNLRSPAGNIQMLIGEMEHAATEADKQEYFDLLKRSSNALIETLQDLIDILEVRLNKSLPFENCHFEQILQKVTPLLSGEIQEKHAEIETRFELESISYPKVYLESILYNLLSNSLKYGDTGRTPRILLHSFEKEGNRYLCVKDNGLGIDLDRYGVQMFKFRKIFHRGFDSKGVGLFMTRNQIETLGGKITVESTPGEGTLFTIKF